MALELWHEAEQAFDRALAAEPQNATLQRALEAVRAYHWAHVHGPHTQVEPRAPPSPEGYARWKMRRCGDALLAADGAVVMQQV